MEEVQCDSCGREQWIGEDDLTEDGWECSHCGEMNA